MHDQHTPIDIEDPVVGDAGGRVDAGLAQPSVGSDHVLTGGSNSATATFSCMRAAVTTSASVSDWMAS